MLPYVTLLHLGFGGKAIRPVCYGGISVVKGSPCVVASSYDYFTSTSTRWGPPGQHAGIVSFCPTSASEISVAKLFGN